ncbi:hypothetical protein ACRPK2_08860 [Lactococcus garvieae]|uniref:hypothetical protein n=1 Tax=Lactococcus garvieae TaxID=1363 RepID=UPI003D78A395
MCIEEINWNTQEDYFKQFLAMPSEKQCRVIVDILEKIKENNLEDKFFCAIENIFEESTKISIKSWFEA